jgi:multicomponent Na+:H+ antiporter subunit E
MCNESYSTTEKLRGYLYLFLLLMVVWLILTASINPQELFTGAVVSLILSFIFGKTYLAIGLPPFGIKRSVFFLIFLFVLFWEIIKANFDVAYRVLHPRMPIKPGIVTIKTGLKQDIAKIILANSITLTPGTFTLDILGDTLLIHWIDVKTEDIEKRTGLIGGKFEKYLKHVFG